MERLRQERIRAASSRTEPLTERERLLFIRGVGERTVQLLEDAGYRTVEDILREDEDKLAIKTGLGIKKARAIKQGAEHFLSGDAKTIEAARREAVAKAREARRSRRPERERRRRSHDGHVRETESVETMHERPKSDERRPDADVRGLRPARRRRRRWCASSCPTTRSCSTSPAAAFGRGAHLHARPDCLAKAPRGVWRARSSAT